MKKLLTFLTIIIIVPILTAVGFLTYRYVKNPLSVVPLPYTFDFQYPKTHLNSPILISGDRMAVHLTRFKTELAATISSELSNPIKIESIAQEGEGIHRTIHRLESLSPWPQILIYQGGSEEFFESKFLPGEIQSIHENFKLFDDDKIETALILYPILSRFVYKPFQRIHLKQQIVEDKDISEKKYLSRLETELMLYERHLLQMVNMARDKNTLLILTTTPVKLNSPPRKTCEFTTSVEIESEIIKVNDFLKAGNMKSAYQLVRKLSLSYPSNASLYFLHGEIAFRLEDYNEAYNAFEKSASFDCTYWRASPLQNNIIRKVAKDQQVMLFDMDLLVQKSGDPKTLFYDEIYPQNLYYERSMNQLGLVIKKILKL